MLPVLLLLFVNIIDLGQVINRYLTLTQVAYEGARYGASLAGMATLDNQATATSEQKKQLVIDRINMLLEKVSLKLLADDLAQQPDLSVYQPQVTVAYFGTAGAVVPAECGAMVNNSICVVVRLPYNPYFRFPLWDRLPITVRANAPYLFKETDLGNQG